MNVHLQVQGIEALKKALSALAFDDARHVKEGILKHAAEPMADRMGELAPWEPGRPDLKDSIRVQVVRSFQDAEIGQIDLADDEAAVAVGPSKDAFYGYFQEYGVPPHGTHPGNPPQPFARPAFDETSDTALKIVADDSWAYVRKTLDRMPSSGGRNL